MNNKRDTTIDVARGVGIVLMVWGHVNGPFKTPYIYLFHMALFFIISGYIYEYHNDSSIKKYIIKRAKRLYIPHVVSGLILVILTNLFVDWHLLDSSYRLPTILVFAKKITTVLLFGGGDSLLGANWFLRSMFFGTIIYEIEHRIIKKRVILIMILNLCLIFGGWFFTMKIGFGKWMNILSVPVLLDIGKIFRQHKLLNQIKLRYYLFFPISLFVIFLLGFFGEISLNNNRIVNPIFFLLCAISGFIMTISYSVIIQKFNILKKIHIYLGQNTMSILLLHYLSLKIVTLMQIIIFKMEIDNLTAYPTLITDNFWWIIYLFVGISIPICLQIPAKYITKKIGLLITNFLTQTKIKREK